MKCVLVYGTAFILGVVQSDFPLTNEIYSRTAPNLMDLMIALGGGAAGAYAMISPRLSVAFVGVAVATALVPPLCVSAICMARGEFSLAFGALLLVVTNIVAIQVACSAVMWVGGYRGTPQDYSGSALKRNLLSVTVLGCLTVLLGIHLHQLISDEVDRAAVRRTLNTASATHRGAALTDVRFQQQGPGHTVVIAVYRTPVPFTPAEVGELELRLPLMPGATSQELRIRSVPVTVASKAGYLYSSADLGGSGQTE